MHFFLDKNIFWDYIPKKWVFTWITPFDSKID